MSPPEDLLHRCLLLQGPRPGLGSRAKGQSPDSRLCANPAFPLWRWPLRVRSPVTVAGPCRTRTGFLAHRPLFVFEQHSRASGTRQLVRMQVRRGITHAAHGSLLDFIRSIPNSPSAVLGFVTNLLVAHGYLVILFGAALDNFGLPASGDIVLFAGGLFANGGQLALPLVMLSGFAGAFISDNSCTGSGASAVGP